MNQSSMTIGIDARMLGLGYGLARYVEQLITHLEHIDDKHQYVLFLRKENWDMVPVNSTRFKKVLADIPWYSLAEQIEFPRIIAREHLDLMHFPHFNVPVFYRQPFVVTIHDLTMYHYPRAEATTLGPIKFFLKDLAHRIVIRHAVKKAKHIIVTSEFTKQDVANTLRVPTERMTVIYQSPSGVVIDSGEDIQKVVSELGIREPYVLYVGASYPHKNLEGLLRAWALFEEKNGKSVQLVLAGKKNYFYDRLLASDAMKHCQNVVYAGLVSDAVLSHLYSRARLFVYPSLYEGFGLPPLEAMVHGVPVVSSNRACLPEVLGEAAIYVDPENIAQISDAIHTGLTNESIRSELRSNMPRELARYSNQRMVRETLGVYQKAL